MFTTLVPFLVVFLTGLVVSLVLTPWVRALAHRHGVVDLPNERRPHRRPTARGGGVAVLIAFHAACLVAVALPWPEMQGDLDFAWWRRFAMGSGILLVVGLVDDVRGMRPGYKLVGQALAAFALWWGGLRFGALLELSFGSSGSSMLST
jgi:UDP-GlcNAc:undecaprenyl-phosphate GlcNAc-1-phosphate transferase